ncbi:quinoprotein dehydrogenase-associated SoxYZ-like carrier [Paracoccaceae bacterium Fryx2]|nr:quinoprotein dehydrogenase-associated SoxYZ-like carrier [Paracoccaceae bacterium Fryx2]
MQWKACLAVVALLCAAPATADEAAWPDIRHQLYGERVLHPAAGVITLAAPYRTGNDARTVIGAEVAAPPGRMLSAVTLVLDNNPMPVSTVFRLAEPQARFRFDATLRINGQTPLHVVAETSDGQLFVADGYVKTSGQGACAAPPVGDPALALATLGQMTIAVGETGTLPLRSALANLRRDDMRMTLGIRHPSHSGMQMDQISLLFIPMRYVETVQIGLDGRRYVDVTGSISLSEDPELSLSIPAATRAIDVTMTDTDGTTSTAERRLAAW